MAKKNNVKKKIDIKVGEKLKELRLTNRYSLEQIGKVLKRTRQAVFYFENGTSSVPIDILIKLCDIYDYDYIKFLEEVKEYVYK